METKNVIDVNDLRERLKNDKVYFQYEKIDGTVRKAHGTLNIRLIPENLRPKDKDDSSNDVIDSSMNTKIKNIKYFDIEKEQWRSISKNVLTVEIFP